MFKKFLNHSSPTALMLFDAEGSGKTPVELAREAIAKNTVVSGAEKEIEPTPNEEGDDNEEDEEADDDSESDEDDEEGEKEEDKEKVEETEEEKTKREAEEAKTEKENRKASRIQKRIDKAVAAQRIAETRVAELEAQLKADPDKTLTEEEINKRAETIAAQKIADKEVAQVQKDFEKACDKLQDAAVKIDKGFTPKVQAMAEELGPIPSRIITILDDLDNGHEVLKFMVDDVDEAEKLYDLKDKPEKLAIALVRISDKLALAKKPKPKQISKVPDPIEPVNGKRIQSTVITGKETTEEYIRKRQVQIAENRKSGRIL